jgi:2-amino-4-hydroxy-6-hydroxymethyldihydropteridine diphosphokinase
MLPGDWLYLGLGSNLGRRAEHLRGALEALRLWTELERVQTSAVYQTAAVGSAEGQPDFWNLCARLRVSLDPHLVLHRCLDLERRFGRPTRGRGAARTLDIDLLFWGDRRIVDPDLVLPHPRLRQRRFVLEPLLDLDPGLRLPGGDRVRDLWAEPGIQAQRVQRLGRLEELPASAVGVVS